MGLAGPAVQGAVAPARRGGEGGIVMTGLGAGVILASLCIPAFLKGGVAAAWLGLAGLVLLLWAFAHPRWPATPIALSQGEGPRAGAAALFVLYGLSGAGMVPHMIYFVDFAVRGRGLDPTVGALTWVLFGAGGIVGSIAGGRAADRLGGRRSLQIWLALQVLGVGLALVPGGLILVPAALVGACGGVGITAVALARARELAGPNAVSVWVRATAVFAIAQAVTAFAMTALFAHTGMHEALFGAGLVLSLTGLLVSLRWA